MGVVAADPALEGAGAADPDFRERSDGPVVKPLTLNAPTAIDREATVVAFGALLPEDVGVKATSAQKFIPPLFTSGKAPATL